MQHKGDRIDGLQTFVYFFCVMKHSSSIWRDLHQQKKRARWMAWGRWKWLTLYPESRKFPPKIIHNPFIMTVCIHSFSFTLDRVIVNLSEDYPKNIRHEARGRNTLWICPSQSIILHIDTHLVTTLYVCMFIRGGRKPENSMKHTQKTIHSNLSSGSNQQTPKLWGGITLHNTNTLSWKYLFTLNSWYARILPYIIPYRSTEPRTCFEPWSIATLYCIIFPALFQIFVLFFLFF